MNKIKIRKKIIIYFKLIRIHQWFKNLLIILPVLTTQKTLTFVDYKSLIYVFILFSLVSSLVYVFNDLIDQDSDSNHPIKKDKPLPKKEITLFETLLVISFIIVIFLALSLSTTINNENIFIIVSYLLLSILYSLLLKKIIIVDVLLVSVFYVLRVKCGVNEINESISNLIYLQIYFASIFILFCKRYSDLNYTINLKSITNIYDKKSEILKLLINLLLLVNIIIYLLIINSEYLINKYGSKPYYVTVIFVIFSFLRYRHYTFKNFNTIDPVKTFFKSKTLIISNVSWLLAIFALNNLL